MPRGYRRARKPTGKVGPLSGAPKLASIPHVETLPGINMTVSWPNFYLSRIYEAERYSGDTLMGFQYFGCPAARWSNAASLPSTVMYGSGLFRATVREADDFGAAQTVSARDSLQLNLFRRLFERTETLAQGSSLNAAQPSSSPFSSMIQRSVKGLIGLTNGQALYVARWYTPAGVTPTTNRIDMFVRYSVVKKNYNSGSATVDAVIREAMEASEQNSLLGLSDAR